MKILKNQGRRKQIIIYWDKGDKEYKNNKSCRTRMKWMMLALIEL